MARKRRSSLVNFITENISISLKHSVSYREFILTYLLDIMFLSCLFYALIQMGPSIISALSTISKTGNLATLPSERTTSIVVRMWMIFAAFTLYYFAKLCLYNAFLVRFDEMRRKKKVNTLSSSLSYGLRRVPVVIAIIAFVLLLSVVGIDALKSIGKSSATELLLDAYSIILSLGFLLSIPYAVLKRTSVIESIKKSWRVFLDNPLELLVIYLCGAIVNLVIIFAFLIPAGFIILKVIYPALVPLGKSASMSASQAKAYELVISIIKAILQNKATVFVGGCIFLVGATLSFLFYTSYIAGVFRRFEKR